MIIMFAFWEWGQALSSIVVSFQSFLPHSETEDLEKKAILVSQYTAKLHAKGV